MVIYALVTIINVIAVIFLGLTVYLKNRKAILNKLFFLFCFSVFLWSFFYFLWLIFIENKQNALFFGKALNIAAIFIPVTYFHFITVFLNIYQKRKKLVISGYLLAFILFISGFTPLFVRDVAPELFFPWYPKPGITYHLFTLMFFSFVVYSWYLMFRAIKKATRVANLQIKYVLIGTLIGFTGGSTSFFPVYGISIPPFGTGLVIIPIVFITLAILKYHLFEIRVILTEILVGVMGILLLVFHFLLPGGYRILGLGIFLLFCLFGYLLIRATHREIKRREEIEKLYAKLRVLDKAKSEFISMASHQLRTPLTAIKGYISMITEGSYGQIPEKAKEKMENVFQSTERLIKLVNVLLNLSKIELGKMELEKELVQIEDLIQSCYKEMKIKAKEKKLKFIFQKSKMPLPKIKIDSLKIRQVILNLIDNAIRYTQKGEIEIRVEKKNSKILISVRDTGEGLTKEEKKRIFEGFTRGQAGVTYWIEGAGLGLYISKKYIELHRGKIWAESGGKGKGSIFYVELPIW